MKFVTIEGSTSYDKLKAMPSFVRSQDVLLDSLFSSVKTELNQVLEDLQFVHKVIESDIRSETAQMSKLDERLRGSAKKINHIYMKNLRFRHKYGTSTHGSKRFQLTKDNIEELDERIGNISTVKEQILNKFIDVDMKLRKNQRLLLSDSINERHYPIIFALLKKRHPTLLDPHTPEEINPNETNIDYIEGLGHIDLQGDEPDCPVEGIEGEYSDIQNTANEINNNFNIITDDTLTANENVNMYRDNDDIVISPIILNDVDNENNASLSSTISSTNIQTSTFTVRDRNRIKTSLSSPFVLGSFKKPSSAKTLATMENISASNITSAHLSNQN